MDDTPELTFRANPAQIQSAGKSFPSRQGGLGEKWGEKMMEKRIRIALAMQNKPRISIVELAAELDMAPDGIEKHLKVLRETGCIKRIGPAKGGHWEVQP